MFRIEKVALAYIKTRRVKRLENRIGKVNIVCARGDGGRGTVFMRGRKPAVIRRRLYTHITLSPFKSPSRHKRVKNYSAEPFERSRDYSRRRRKRLGTCTVPTAHRNLIITTGTTATRAHVCVWVCTKQVVTRLWAEFFSTPLCQRL